jgi:hypothetical protein
MRLSSQQRIKDVAVAFYALPGLNPGNKRKNNRVSMENENPVLQRRTSPEYEVVLGRNGKIVEFSREAVFQMIRHIRDPEHPHSLEDLGVVSLDGIYFCRHRRRGEKIAREKSIEPVGESVGPPVLSVALVPTIPHCSLISIIGLSVLWVLRKVVPPGYEIELIVEEESHLSGAEVTKQLNDRERVEAAFENNAIIESVEGTLSAELLELLASAPSGTCRE